MWNQYVHHRLCAEGREQFATVLAAASAGKKIFIETWMGCPSTDVSLNWGMKVGAIAIQY